MRALRVLAGPAALRHLQQHGMQPQHIGLVAAAAGGPKGLILNPLDRFIFGHWLPQSSQVVHLLGASIGSWRMAAAVCPDADAALARMAADYIAQDYPHAPGKPPLAAEVSAVFGAKLKEHFQAQAEKMLAHPRLRLHVVTSRGRHLLRREGRWRTPLGYGGAFVSNLVTRAGLGLWLERVVFSDPRDALPLPLKDFRSQVVALQTDNLCPAILASCSIPFWLKAVQDIPHAPEGAYWDGGITDYHLRWPYHHMLGTSAPLVLYPHFQPSLVPGWLDKMLPYRHGATSALDNVVVLAPRSEWIARLPASKLPDRSDFQTMADDVPGRMRRWQEAVALSQQLADEFAQWAQGGVMPEVEALR